MSLSRKELILSFSFKCERSRICKHEKVRCKPVEINVYMGSNPNGHHNYRLLEKREQLIKKNVSGRTFSFAA